VSEPYYADDHVTIYHGDALEVLPTLPQCDLVLTDPPFSAATHSNAKTNRGGGHESKAIKFDSLTATDVRNLLGNLGSHTTGWVVTSLDWRHIAHLEDHPPHNLRLMRFGVWVKPNPMPQISGDRPGQGWEGIAYLHRDDVKPTWNGGGSHGNFVLPVAQSNEHPTQKPIEMLHTLVERFSDSDATVLDPFMGSGTTLRAAKDLGRKAIGIELEERYCEIAAKRCAQEVLAL
jgi:site-specific DNA-methyltransferase (adenine-specific)